MMKTHFLLIFVMIQLVFGVQPVRFDVNRGPARRSLIIRAGLSRKGLVSKHRKQDDRLTKTLRDLAR